VNLGTGTGSSVLEVVGAFEKASGRPIPYEIKPRRAGDIDAYYAATETASQLMGWKATRSLETMCADHWRWQSNNPNGYC
jgi:UDP-glucose 4-epimerase